MIWRIKQLAAGLILGPIIIPGLLSIGSAVEERFFPVRGAQAIDHVLRGDRSMCWRWLNVKRRPVASDNLDALLFDGTGEVSVVAPYDPVNRSPWRYGGAVPPSISIQWWCVDLPPWIQRGDWVRLEQRIRYPGLWGLWSIHTRIPEVADGT